MKVLFRITLCLLLVLGLSSCSKDKPVEAGAQVDETPEVSSAAISHNNAADNENDADGMAASAAIKSGEIYRGNDVSYNVIGVRTNEYQDGTRYLIVKLEVYNHSSDDVNYSIFDRLSLYSGKTEYNVDIMADVDTALSGMITPGNKIMGEAAFDISDSKKDEYVLYVGSGFNYSPAINISSDDIGKTFAEQFEASGVKSDYTIGVPLESEQLTVLLNSATVIPSDKEDKEILLLDLDITNNESDIVNFMLGINFNGVYTTDGIRLESAFGEWTLRADLNANETINGIASFYIEKGMRDFYMTVTPNLHENSSKANIVFSAE